MSDVKLIIHDDFPEVKLSVVTDPAVTIKIKGESGADVPVYDGDVMVIPSAENDVILPTKDRILTENIMIKEIPYAEVSNDAGGYTVSIAS